MIYLALLLQQIHPHVFVEGKEDTKHEASFLLTCLPPIKTKKSHSQTPLKQGRGYTATCKPDPEP